MSNSLRSQGSDPKSKPLGVLDFSGYQMLPAFKEKLTVRELLFINNPYVEALSADIECMELNMSNTPIKVLPKELQVDGSMILNGCTKLESLPPGLNVAVLDIRGCVSLKALPENMHVNCLYMSGCTQITQFPKRGMICYGILDASNCPRLQSLPKWIKYIGRLDVHDCRLLTSIPEGIQVTEWIDIGGTGIKKLPKSLQGVEIRWRGVRIDEKIAFHPETITADDIMSQHNAEVRRVMLERMGYERFVKQAEMDELDTDHDAGGVRRLLKRDLWRDEPLVVVTYRCPSTGRLYVTRVPPTMQTCHQAVAWIGGFDDPDKYKLIAEA